VADLIALPSPAEETRVCKTCKQEKPLSKFYAHGASRGGHVRSCKSCYMDQRKQIKIGSLEGRLKSIFANVTERRHKGLDISLQDLRDLWEKQKGLCAYSGVPMMWDDSNRYATVSIDRIDSSKGYVRGNIAFCCAIVNVMKNKMPVEHFLWWCRNISSTLGEE
jgi:hypothetical protein